MLGVSHLTVPVLSMTIYFIVPSCVNCFCMPYSMVARFQRRALPGRKISDATNVLGRTPEVVNRPILV